MELGQPVERAVLARDRLAPRRRRPLAQRLRARVFTARLDTELAWGTDPQSDPTLALRAERLSSPVTRRQLARGLRDVVARAERRSQFSAAAPVARISVLRNRELLGEVADHLDSDLPAGVGGIAAVNLLLTDGASPLWAQTEGRELHDTLEAAMVRLGA
jgi:hypothetical protein